jgi:hypothetical protein
MNVTHSPRKVASEVKLPAWLSLSLVPPFEVSLRVFAQQKWFPLALAQRAQPERVFQ